MRLLLIVTLGLCCNLAFAQIETGPWKLTTAPIAPRPAEPGLGRELRASVQQSVEQSLKGDNAQARVALLEVAQYCDAYRAVAGRRAVSFRTQRQYELYLADHNDGTPLDWLDMACADAYKQLAYIAVEYHDTDQAMQWLDQAQATAPYEADVLTERGIAFNQRKDWRGALASYQQALELTRSHPEAAHLQALALRGVGFSLIELGDLPSAQSHYEQSLELEPDNPVALQELTYIQQLRERAGGK